MKTVIKPSLAEAICASIERAKVNANTSAVAKPYVPKRPSARKLDASALAASLERGKELVDAAYQYIAGEQCIYNVQEVGQLRGLQEVAA